ncbi:lytic transglycosylase [Streptomyces longispororuber]|uniref:Lytic transglycosylase n=1 Tax=Streptomyces longispororuber TaxID=68230 RepID=A0A918Z8R6_9ACTN|nr:lytic murein transglycosylase [Streptomyces longispororuber]GHE40522.1 lytic transglycosylase [Streptomyces longispororuber]
MAPVIGKRLRKATVTTAVAAAAVAALAASQAPGVATTDKAQGEQAADTTPPPGGDSATGNSPYYTDLPPLHSPVPPTSKPGGAKGDPEAGLPATVLDAYKKAEAAVRTAKPGCNLPWQLLAAIGKVESGQARGGRVDDEGTTLTPILGPVLDGNGFARITDTDGGAFDGDTTHDRAVGPMQFIPSTWATSGQDGNGDGEKDPNNIYDAALAAAHYLCGSGRDLSVTGDLHAAILSYNRSTEYLNTVLSWLEFYRKGTHEIPDGTGRLPDDRSDEQPRRPGPTTPPSTPPSLLPDPTPLERQGHYTPPPADGSGKPGNGGNNGNNGNDGGNNGGSQKPGGDGKPQKPDPKPNPQDQVARLENAGPPALTATAGEAFERRAVVRAETGSGRGVPKAKIRFTISGKTDTRFEGGVRSVTVTTGGSGVATSPKLTAGETTGTFTVRALVVGRSLDRVEVPGTVTSRKADALTLLNEEPQVCEAGKAFADRVAVAATYEKKPLAGAAATATLVKAADDPAVNDKGPYFKDAAGKPVRVLKGLTTDARGKLLLPKLYAGDAAGTYLLRVVADGGATLVVELKVTAPAAGEPDESQSPSATPSGSASPSTGSSPSAGSSPGA